MTIGPRTPPMRKPGRSVLLRGKQASGRSCRQTAARGNCSSPDRRRRCFCSGRAPRVLRFRPHALALPWRCDRVQRCGSLWVLVLYGNPVASHTEMGGRTVRTANQLVHTLRSVPTDSRQSMIAEITGLVGITRASSSVRDRPPPECDAVSAGDTRHVLIEMTARKQVYGDGLATLRTDTSPGGQSLSS
jgi:hypothetical protein